MTRADELTRFTMSLPTDDYDRLGELAGLLGMSRAALLRDLIASARPVWAVLLDAARTTAAAPQAQREAMERLAESMGKQIDVAQALFGDFTATLEASATLDGPPPSNTGVRNL